MIVVVLADRNAFEEMLRQALMADARRPRHERRTARALHTQIKTSSQRGTAWGRRAMRVDPCCCLFAIGENLQEAW